MRNKLPETGHGAPSGKELLLLIPAVIVMGIADIIAMPFKAIFRKKK